jgi:hypothetical protein
VSPRTVLDAVVKRKIPSPRRESNPRTPIVQPVGQRYRNVSDDIILHIETAFSPLVHTSEFISTGQVKGEFVPVLN